MITIEDLCANDSTKQKTWHALQRYAKKRFKHKKTISIPNMATIAFRTTQPSAHTFTQPHSATSNTPQPTPPPEPTPVFHLNPRFVENFRVKAVVTPDTATPPPTPAPSDEINFYMLAIAHSDGLSKDEVFTHLRELLMLIARQAGAGATLAIDFGVGMLLSKKREVWFDFEGTASVPLRAGAEQLSAPVDPLLGARDAPNLNVSGSTLRGASARSVAASSSKLTAKLTATSSAKLKASSSRALAPAASPPASISALRSNFRSELQSQLSLVAPSAVSDETRLFAEVDALDPETRADMGADVEAAWASLRLRSLQLSQPTVTRTRQVLGMGAESLASCTLDEVGRALAAKTAQLEDELKTARERTRALEEELQRHREPNAAPKPAADAVAVAAAAESPQPRATLTPFGPSHVAMARAPSYSPAAAAAAASTTAPPPLPTAATSSMSSRTSKLQPQQQPSRLLPLSPSALAAVEGAPATLDVRLPEPSAVVSGLHSSSTKQPFPPSAVSRATTTPSRLLSQARTARVRNGGGSKLSTVARSHQGDVGADGSPPLSIGFRDETAQLLPPPPKPKPPRLRTIVVARDAMLAPAAAETRREVLKQGVLAASTATRDAASSAWQVYSRGHRPQPNVTSQRRIHAKSRPVGGPSLRRGVIRRLAPSVGDAVRVTGASARVPIKAAEGERITT